MAAQLVGERRVAVLAAAGRELPVQRFGHAATEQRKYGLVVASAVRRPAACRRAIACVHAGRGRDLAATVFTEAHEAILPPRSLAA